MRYPRPLFMLVTAGAVAAAALLTCETSSTRADENKKNELRREIERLLSDTASELRDVPGDSSASDIERTIEYASRVYDKARELKDHAENDSDARRIADYYPDYARKYQEAARFLKEMKNTQRRLDEMPRKCEDKSKELASRLRAYTDSHDPRGVEEVPMKRDDVCGNLAKEERNPMVEEAMRKLFDGKKGIEMLYESLDRQLGETAGLLDRLEGDSNSSDVQNAENKLNEVEKLLEQLDRIKGNDGEAKRRVETWRNIVRAGREGLKHLRTLKEAQFLADRAPERCKETTEKLREHIRRALDDREENSATGLKQDARALGEPVKAALAKTDEQHPTMERALSDAQRFDPSEGRWREVTEKHRASAAAVFEYWKKARETAHGACDELAKGAEHKEVVAAVADLASTLGDVSNQLKVLEADHRKWEEGIRELREWYKADTTAVREMFCSLPESPGDYTEGDAYSAKLAQIADRMRDRLRPKWSQISRDAEGFLSRAEVLVRSKDKTVRPGAARLRQAVADRMSGLQKLLDNELNGSNDPELRAKMEFGKNEHKRIQSDSSKCTASELTFGSSRVDCILVSSNVCYVVEIKPNNKDARNRGDTQIQTGIGEIKRALGGKKKRDELTGNLEVLRPCFDEASQSIDMKPRLHVYEYCPPEGELFKDFVVP